MSVLFITPSTITVLSSLPSVWGMNVDICQVFIYCEGKWKHKALERGRARFKPTPTSVSSLSVIITYFQETRKGMAN